MPYYEIIYETGNHSLAYYEDDSEAFQACEAHHERAKNGQDGNGQSIPRADVPNAPVGGWKAERIVKIFKYDTHPAKYGEAQTVSIEEAKRRLDDAFKTAADPDAGVVRIPELTSAVQDLAFAMVEDAPPHESRYKMPETEKLAWDAF